MVALTTVSRLSAAMPPSGSTPPRRFAVHGVFWRECIDWIVLHVPVFFLRPVVFLATLIFFFFAAPARRTVIDHLAVILPGSGKLPNYLRAFRIFWNFGWTLADAASYRLLHCSF